MEQSYAPRLSVVLPAREMICRKTGQVTWHADHIEVELEPYRCADQRRAMKTTYARFNAADLCWRDGQALRVTVAGAD